MDFAQIIEFLREWLQSLSPFWLFWAIVILPLFWFPVSPILVALGMVCSNTWQAYGLALLGLTINMMISYAATLWLREPLQRLCQRWGKSVPEVSGGDAVRLVILFRITPGFPFPLQNYLLGLARVPFFTYLFYSILFQLIYVYGFIVLGGSLMSGKILWVLVGIALILFTSFAFRIIAKRQGQKKESSADA